MYTLGFKIHPYIHFLVSVAIYYSCQIVLTIIYYYYKLTTVYTYRLAHTNYYKNTPITITLVCRIIFKVVVPIQVQIDYSFR